MEATSLTPFAERARDRALHAVLISMARHLNPGLRNNNDAAKADLYSEDLTKYEEYIIDQTDIVDDSETASTKEHLEEIIRSWISLAQTEQLVYQNFGNNGEEPLLVAASEHMRKGFPTLNSMRNVDIESDVYLEG